MGMLMLVVAAAVLLGYCQTNENVSFYGASYIHFPVQEAKGATDISFRFRTHLPDAILLLAAGKTDYCLIKLEAGRLKVHINLGAGESELASPSGLTLNDLTWHEVNITRREANITLEIDVIHTTRSILPGRFFELNIHYGVYIGGLGYFNELFLGHTEYLRGCMADIMYNGAQVVEYAKTRRSKSEAIAITWGCSAEFDASRDVEVSFLEDGAFTSIPRPIPRQGSRWEFELKTGTDSGMLLYNTGHASYADYLGIELHNGNIRVLMNKGNGPTELTHGGNVTDGKWHRVSIDFTPSMITIKIDDHEKRMNLPSGGNRYLDLAETVYIGGTELNKRARAIAKGLYSGHKSFKGCLRDMILDGKPLGLPDVKVSQGIVAGCVWRYSCLADKVPCRADSICEQVGVESFVCKCDQRETCTNDDHVEDRPSRSMNESTNLPVNLDILSLTQLCVFEGEKVVVSRLNIEIIMDIARYGMNESDVKIIIVIPPSRGAIYQDTQALKRNSSFSLRDVDTEKIQYVHDGSESTEDKMILELRLESGANFKLPSYLEGGLRFLLRVNITPVNDPPVLEISATKVLRLAQGTRRTLSKELVWTVDADTPSEMLTYTVLRADTDAGHVERLDEPGKSIATFTQAELLRGNVAYVHRGNAKSNALLGLQVSDGMANSLTGFLRISAYPLQIKLIHNTGLVVVHRSFTHLRSSNLSFATNSDDPSIEILYQIVTLPVYGLLQKFNNSTGSWTSVDRFTSRDIENENIRYLHNIDSPSTDEFKFQASVREVKTQQNFDFRINFIDLELKEARKIAVNFSDAIDVLVTSENLRYQTNPLITYPSKIKYSIVKATKYGITMLVEKVLKDGDVFTQDDIDAGRLKYRLFKSAYSLINDELIFQVTAPQCQTITSNLSLTHRWGRNNKNFEHLEMLRVDEGSKIPLDIVFAEAKTHGVNRILYNVTVVPKSGWLTVEAGGTEKTRPNATYFTSEELDDKRVYYHHDDSETDRDSFKYVAVSTDDTDFMYAGLFDVRIKLQNDNPPIRRNLKDFHVVTNGERVLTNDNLLYEDIDTGTRWADLIFRRRNTSNIDIYRIDDNSRIVDEFTQQDVNDRKIVIKHAGVAKGLFQFTVTDGHWLIDDQLRIIASSPYVHFITNNASIVRFNASVALTLREIDVETNVNVNDKEIRFSVMARPKHGVILRNGREMNDFTRDDLIRQMILYQHHGDSLSKDDFKIRALVRDVSAESRVTVKVYGKSYWEPLIVKNNRTILVEETTSVVLSRKNLEIQHPNITPSEIVYFVRERPKYGYLEVQNNDEAHAEESMKEDDDPSMVRHFDQSMINDGRVYYVQSMINRTEDHFIVDVTNGVTWTRFMIIKFVIIPDKIYVEAAQNLTVVEGKSVALNTSIFRVLTSYYSGKITDYRIIGKPKHGTIIDSTKSSQIKKFSQKHLNASVIVYKHNGDEFPYDDLRIIAIAADKSSGPIDLRINVIPINDELPVLVNRTIINVWQGGSIALNSEQLASVDNDTAANELVYNLTGVKNGYLWHNDTPHVYIYNFTQAQIDRSKIIFTHTNGTAASFSFVLFDGVHSTINYDVSITTRPVHLTLRVNNPLNVFPLTRKSISTTLLLTECSDPKRDVRYVVRKRPNLGKIIMETSEGTWQEVDRFTQNDVNASRVTYEHTKQFMDLSTNDSFVFDVETHFAESISNQIFRIDVSVSSGGLDRYITAKTVRVEEGGSASVVMNITGIVKYLRTKAGIDSPIVLSRLTHQPSHGHVMLLPDLNITTFDQQQIENEKIAYYHDHSDTIEDRISFSLYLSPGHVMLCNASVPVVISPINDEPFKLVTNEPFITVVQNQTRTIKRENLLTTDPDTGPDGLVYDLISGPTCGRLLLVPYEQNTSDIQQVTRWTQQDIDANRLVYEHNGTTQAASFYFRVSDQSFNPVYKLFNVQVLPIRLSVTVAKSVSLPQGSNMADISENNVKLDTNARQEQVIYEITKSPKHGMLYVRDVAAVNFRHADLLSRSVIFVQTDMYVSNDSFSMTARLSNYRTNEVKVDITVIPLMIMQSMNAIAGEKTQMTRRHMDATPLAELTRSTPQYRVTRKPKHCKIKRIIRSYGEKRVSREREVSRFAHTEIISEVIYVVCRRLPPTETDGLTDSFEFILTAASYQPAKGLFVIRVRNNSGETNGTLSGPMDPVGHEGEMAVAPNTSNDYILIIGMLLGVFLLGVVVIITIRCRHNRYKHNDEDKQADPNPTTVGVIPLPRPPDHLMSATNPRHNLKRFGDTSGLTSSTPLPVQPAATATSTLPQCKVIPLSALDSVTGSDADMSARYPYGVADGEDWSSFETGELPCQTATTRRPNPLLRRNQYWV